MLSDRIADLVEYLVVQIVDDPDSVSLEVIEKDVARTLPALHFFGDEETGGNAHGDALRSILFVYSRYNAAIRYVQGMNEVLAPIYYVFAHDPGVSRLYNQQPHRFICLKSSLSHITHHTSHQRNMPRQTRFSAVRT